MVRGLFSSAILGLISSALTSGPCRRGGLNFKGSRILLFQAGCGIVGDALIPPHPNSASGIEELVCLELLPPDRLQAEGGRELISAATAVSVVGGFLIDQTAKAISAEGSRYKASYSARRTGYLLRIDNQTISQNIGTVRLTRWIGKGIKSGCASVANEQSELTMAFEASLNTFHDNKLLKVDAKTLTFLKSKAKVPSPRWFIPWSWWMLADSTSAEIDLNARFTMTGVEETRDGIRSTDVLAVDIPFGKRNLNELVKPFNVDHLGSGWVPMPKITIDPATITEPKLTLLAPVTVTVTITEADDLGDVLASASKQVSDNKDKLLTRLIESLGLKQQEKK